LTPIGKKLHTTLDPTSSKAKVLFISFLPEPKKMYDSKSVRAFLVVKSTSEQYVLDPKTKGNHTKRKISDMTTESEAIYKNSKLNMWNMPKAASIIKFGLGKATMVPYDYSNIATHITNKCNILTFANTYSYTIDHNKMASTNKNRKEKKLASFMNGHLILSTNVYKYLYPNGGEPDIWKRNNPSNRVNDVYKEMFFGKNSFETYEKCIFMTEIILWIQNNHSTFDYNTQTTVKEFMEKLDSELSPQTQYWLQSEYSNSSWSVVMSVKVMLELDDIEMPDWIENNGPGIDELNSGSFWENSFSIDSIHAKHAEYLPIDTLTNAVNIMGGEETFAIILWRTIRGSVDDQLLNLMAFLRDASEVDETKGGISDKRLEMVLIYIWTVENCLNIILDNTYGSVARLVYAISPIRDVPLGGRVNPELSHRFGYDETIVGLRSINWDKVLASQSNIIIT